MQNNTPESIAKQLEPRQPVYKRVKAIAEFCPVCKERLQGNNSYNTPWHCSCGEWELVQPHSFGARTPFRYQIKIKAL
jgi:hypothetical protein